MLPLDLENDFFVISLGNLIIQKIVLSLGVHPRYSGHSYAKKLVRFAIEYAKQNHQKAIRLDFLKGNIPAERLYSSMGFKYLHTLQMYYQDTGLTDYELYELPL